MCLHVLAVTCRHVHLSVGSAYPVLRTGHRRNLGPMQQHLLGCQRSWAHFQPVM